MIDSGSAKARRFMAKDANVTEIGTEGSQIDFPSLIDTKLICLPRDESPARRVERRQRAEEKTPEKLWGNTTSTLLRS